MNEVVWSEKGTDAASSYTVHGAGLQVHKQGPGDIFTSYKQIIIQDKYFYSLSKNKKTVQYMCN